MKMSFVGVDGKQVARSARAKQFWRQAKCPGAHAPHNSRASLCLHPLNTFTYFTHALPCLRNGGIPCKTTIVNIIRNFCPKDRCILAILYTLAALIFGSIRRSKKLDWLFTSQSVKSNMPARLLW